MTYTLNLFTASGTKLAKAELSWSGASLRLAAYTQAYIDI